MLRFVRSHRLEGIVAKRADTIPARSSHGGMVQASRRSWPRVCDRWLYPKSFGLDSIVIGVYKGKDLYYAAHVRAGFVPLTRRETFEAIKHLKTAKCPFVNLPEKEAGRWGEGFTAGKR